MTKGDRRKHIAQVESRAFHDGLYIGFLIGGFFSAAIYITMQILNGWVK